MQGELKTEKQYIEIFESLEEEIGREKLQTVHIHFTNIEFNKKSGEVRHLDLSDEVFGPDYKPFLKAVKKMNLTPTIINESREFQFRDAKTMRVWYNKL